MRIVIAVALVVGSLASSAMAGITLTSYTTTALTNGFAPSFQGPYFEQQTLTNVSPAVAQVSGDWFGPNEDGTPDTWHWVGSSRSSSTTTFDGNSYSVTAGGLFEFQLGTTGSFVDPRPSVLTPTGAANYEGFFTTDVPMNYSIIGQLTARARVRLNTSAGTVIFNQANQTSLPVPVSLAGTIAPGQYRVLITTGLSVPNFQNGLNQYQASGRYDSIIFNVQVPEPNASAILTLVVSCTICCRSCRARAS